MSRVAVVTGSNKGIGFALVRALCQNFKGDVVLTARNQEKGVISVELLKGECLNPKFHQLDVCDSKSIDTFRDYLQSTYGGLDVLVNNAGIMYIGAQKRETPTLEQAQKTLKTNLFAVFDVCDRLFPILRPGARVVNIASVLGTLKHFSNPEIRKKLTSDKLSIADIVACAEQYLRDVESGVQKENGWPQPYEVSKGLLIAATKVQARLLREDSRENILVNACCPGWVKTDLTGNTGTKTPHEGVDTPVYLATLPDTATSPNGDFVVERKITQWN